jgi:hypothetical protein
MLLTAPPLVFSWVEKELADPSCVLLLPAELLDTAGSGRPAMIPGTGTLHHRRNNQNASRTAWQVALHSSRDVSGWESGSSNSSVLLPLSTQQCQQAAVHAAHLPEPKHVASGGVDEQTLSRKLMKVAAKSTKR